MNSKSSSVSRLRNSGLQRSLTAATAIGGATASLMTANAAVIFSGPQNLSTDAALGLDPTSADTESVNIDGVGDLEFVMVSFAGKGPATHVLSGGGIVGSGLTNPNHGEAYVKQLAAGATVGPGDDFVGSFNQLTDEVYDGEWPAGSDGYFGFKFNPTGAQDLFGWGHITLSQDNSIMTLVDWAYEDTGAPIRAGVPEPSTSLLLTGSLIMIIACRWLRGWKAAFALAP